MNEKFDSLAVFYPTPDSRCPITCYSDGSAPRRTAWMFPAGITWRCLLIPGTFLLALLSVNGAEPVAEPTPIPDKPYTFFIGLDLEADYAGEKFPVQRLRRGMAEIDVNGRTVQVPLSKLIINRDTKLSRVQAKLDGLSIDRTFAAGGALDQAWNREIREERYREDLRNRSLLQQNNPGVSLSSPSPTAQSNNPDTAGTQSTSTDSYSPSPSRGSNDYFANSNSIVDESESYDPVDFSELEAEAERNNLQDCIDISFAVSSSQPRDDCYVLVLALVRVPENPGKLHRLVFVREIGDLDDKPRKLNIRSQILPAGFEVRRTEIRVFSGLSEIPTNLSDLQTKVTVKQAFDFNKLDYLLQHKTDTLAPVPAEAQLSPAAKSLTAPQLAQLVRVELNAEGAVTAVKEVDGLPTWVIGEVKNFLFFPALTNGQAVASTTLVRLAEHLP